MPAAEPVVVMRGVDLGYGGAPVVRGLDLTLHRGELVALLGPNGAGKSTVVRGILGLSRLTAGRLEVLGTDVGRTHRSHPRLGYVPQRHTVVGGVPTTVREVVASGLHRGSRWRPASRTDRAAIDTALVAVDLSALASRPMSELSGGQQRRSLIARALVGGADVLLMDEPMAGVDLESQSMLAATIGRLVTDGTTLLLVAHELGPLAASVDRVVVLRHGTVVHDGPPSEAVDERFGTHDHAADDDTITPGPGVAPRLGWGG